VYFVFGPKQENAVLSRLLVSYSVYLNMAEKSTPILEFDFTKSRWDVIFWKRPS